jgi:hypothetical protein
VSSGPEATGCKPIHFIFGFYSGMAVFWNYPLMDRFLQLFLPLFYVGLWVEGRHLISLIRANLSAPPARAERILAGVLALGLLTVIAFAAEQYIRGYRQQLPVMAARRASLSIEKLEIYNWIRSNTAPSARFIAYEDVSLYLYTARLAVRPIAFSTQAFYTKDQAILQRDLDHLLDTPRAIGARYWVASADDFDLETGLPFIQKRVKELEESLPLVFRSRNGKVRLYDLCGRLSAPECTDTSVAAQPSLTEQPAVVVQQGPDGG